MKYTTYFAGCQGDSLKKFLESSNLALTLPWLFLAWKVPKFRNRTRFPFLSSVFIAERIVFRTRSDSALG